jgi:enterochelin esterase-like enzyme
MNRSTLLLLAWLSVANVASIAAAEDRRQSAPPLSPRLQQLQQAASTDPAAGAAFWQEVAGKSPLVEPTDDPQRFLVTFLWRGDANLSRVEARGGPYEHSRDPFERLPGTDVWHRSEIIPADARFAYGLIVTHAAAAATPEEAAPPKLVQTYPLDPLNPNVFNEGPVLELPGAPKDDWHIARPNVPKGELEQFTLESQALQEARGLRLYTPANFDPKSDHAFAVFFDGEDCERLMAIPVVLDNLIAAGHIPPTVALLVDSQATRGRDLVFSDPFVRFIADEALPWAVGQRRLRLTPQTTLIGGVSLGGLTAAYVAQERPHLFGNVLSQSGAYWRTHPEQPAAEEGWFPGEVARRPATNVRYYLEVGRFESPAMVAENRRLRDVLAAKGNDVTYCEYNSGHDHVNWRVSVASGLRALLGQPRVKEPGSSPR